MTLTNSQKKEMSVVMKLVDQLSPQLRGIQGRLKVFGDEVKRLARVGFMALAAAAAAAGAALVKIVTSAVQYGTELDKIAKQTGITAEEMSKLQYAAEQEHASVEGITKSLPILAKYMEQARQGMVTYTREFDKMGISVVDAQGNLKSTYNVLLEMSDYYSTATNKTQALAIATTLLGRRGAELVPLLQLGRKGIEELGEEAERLGVVMDNKTAAGMKVFDDNLTKLKKAFQGIGIAITQELLPYLTTLSDELGNLDFEKIRSEARGATESLVEFGSWVARWVLGIKASFEAAAVVFAEIYRFISVFVSSIKQSFLAFSIAVKEGLADLLVRIQSFAEIAGPFLRRFGITIVDGFSVKVQESIDDLTASIERSRQALETEQAYLNETKQAVQDTKNQFWETAKAIERIDSGYKKFTESVKKNSAELVGSVEKIKDVATSTKKAADTFKWFNEQKGEFLSVIKAWAEGVEGIGKSTGKAITTALDGLSSGTAKAFRDMFETGKSFADSMREMFRSLMFDLLEEIMRSQIKQALASLFSFGGSGGGGGFFGGLMGILGGFFAHKGGLVTTSGMKQIGDLQKFHNGGWPGLQRDEVPIIAQTGERILNRQEAAEYSGRGRDENPNYNITINAVDAQSFAMLVRRNPEAIIGVVGENMKRNGALRSISRSTA